jgi:hypothetical protein
MIESLIGQLIITAAVIFFLLLSFGPYIAGINSGKKQ